MHLKAHVDKGLTVVNSTSGKILWTACNEINEYKLVQRNRIIQVNVHGYLKLSKLCM